jgi:DNA-directed RNA polymerase sigma subunit (sigma70/sigma32)
MSKSFSKNATVTDERLLDDVLPTDHKHSRHHDRPTLDPRTTPLRILKLNQLIESQNISWRLAEYLIHCATDNNAPEKQFNWHKAYKIVADEYTSPIDQHKVAEALYNIYTAMIGSAPELSLNKVIDIRQSLHQEFLSEFDQLNDTVADAFYLAYLEKSLHVPRLQQLAMDFNFEHQEIDILLGLIRNTEELHNIEITGDVAHPMSDPAIEVEEVDSTAAIALTDEADAAYEIGPETNEADAAVETAYKPDSSSSSHDDALRRFLAKTSEYNLLTRELEIELANAIHDSQFEGDRVLCLFPLLADQMSEMRHDIVHLRISCKQIIKTSKDEYNTLVKQLDDSTSETNKHDLEAISKEEVLATSIIEKIGHFLEARQRVMKTHAAAFKNLTAEKLERILASADVNELAHLFQSLHLIRQVRQGMMQAIFNFIPQAKQLNNAANACRKYKKKIPEATEIQIRQLEKLLGLELPIFLTIVAEAKKADRKQSDAIKSMTLGNVRLAIVNAKKNPSTAISLAEKISCGQKGIAIAAMKYLPSKLCKFGTYAVNWVRQSIARKVQDDSRVIRLPSHIQEGVNSIASARGKLVNKHQIYDAGSLDIANYMGISEAKVRALSGHARKTTSLDRNIKSDGDTKISECYGGILPRLEQDILSESDMCRTAELLSESSPRAENMSRLRYAGENKNGQDSLEQIGHLHGVTRERTRQISQTTHDQIRTKNLMLEKALIKGLNPDNSNSKSERIKSNRQRAVYEQDQHAHLLIPEIASRPMYELVEQDLDYQRSLQAAAFGRKTAPAVTSADEASVTFASSAPRKRGRPKSLKIPTNTTSVITDEKNIAAIQPELQNVQSQSTQTQKVAEAPANKDTKLHGTEISKQTAKHICNLPHQQVQQSVDIHTEHISVHATLHEKAATISVTSKKRGRPAKALASNALNLITDTVDLSNHKLLPKNPNKQSSVKTKKSNMILQETFETAAA